MRERLWQRVQEHAGTAPKGMKRPATQWIKPGLNGRVKHLRGEEDLRHALVKAHDLSLPGYGFYLIYVPGHLRQPHIEAFSVWMR
jgi:hypothetical protein